MKKTLIILIIAFLCAVAAITFGIYKLCTEDDIFYLLPLLIGLLSLVLFFMGLFYYIKAYTLKKEAEELQRKHLEQLKYFLEEDTY